MLSAKIYFHQLKFITPGGTSRGILKIKPSWFIKIFKEKNPSIFGLGECGPIEGLSIDSLKDIPEKLNEVVKNINHLSKLNLSSFPCIQFGIENAINDFNNGGKRVIFKNSFLTGKPIKINGLVWMGNKDFMLNQVKEKIEKGYSCLKLKIGAINFEDEISIIEQIRKKFSANSLEIRVDANGAFKNDVLFKLKQLNKLKIHSIEQPLGVNQWDKMKKLCQVSPIPIALDEELIGLRDNKDELLSYIKPQFLVLKPTLLGGFKNTREWINEANKRNIDWWITSALESNIGLNAISQFCSEYKLKLPQGLGTGQLFSNNFNSPLELKGEMIYYQKQNNWDLSFFN
tara:strand:- start:115 stop:1146 length:1032 start_codon:yes stop_codon:yes gene_type:complete